MLIGIILLGQIAMAQTKTWNGNTNTDWYEPTNWTLTNGATLGAPTAADEVIINNRPNLPVIGSGNAVARSVSINSPATTTLTISSGVTLTISNTAVKCLNVSAGTLTNNGIISLNNNSAAFVSGEAALMLNGGGVINNNGSITVSGGLNEALRIAQGNFNNNSGANVVANGQTVIRFANANAVFTNNSGASISGTGTTNSLNLNAGRIGNSGNFDVTGQCEMYTSSSEISNSICGKMTINGNVFVQTTSVFQNNGFTYVTGTLTNNGTFTNRGVLKYTATSGSAISNSTTNALIVKDTPTPIFTYGSSSYNGTINGIFKDAGATLSAGVFVSLNTFTPDESLPYGTQTLYAKISPSGQTCSYIVPFLYNNPAPTIRYVKPTATGTGDGLSWANASADIQAMINASAVNDEVWVAAGVYKPQKDGSGNASPSDPRNKLFLMKDGVKVYGGFAGTETLLTQRNWSLNKTIISGDIDNNDTDTDGNGIRESHTEIVGNNAYHLVVFVGVGLTVQPVLDGFILTGGQTFSTPVSAPDHTFTIPGFGTAVISSFRGAALMLSAAAAKIRNCVITGNFANAGVLYQNNQNSWANVITTLQNCYWTGNTNNSAGLLFFHRTWVNMINNVMANNTASSGVLYTSSNMPGGNTININHLTFYNNTTTSASNSPVFFQGGTVNISNSVISNPSVASANIINNAATLSISNSNILGSNPNGTWNTADGTDGGNNIDLPPLFNNASNIIGADNSFFTADDGLSLTSCSPMLNNGSAGLITDILGNIRPFESQTDMGAFEFQSSSTLPANPTAISASSTAITCGQSITLSANCPTGTITWYNISSGGANIGTGTGLSVTPLVNTVYYASCETSGTCVSARRIATGTITVALPADPTNVTVSNTAICSGTQVSLSASCSFGIPEWYNGATALSTTTPFTPIVTTNTTYSVKCKNGTCLSNPVNVPQIIVLSTPTGITTSIRNICGNTIPAITFTATCAVGTVRWYDAPSGGALVGTGSPFVNTPVNPIPGFNRYYPSCSNGTCESNRSSGESFVYTPVPSNAGASPNSICTPNNVTFSATCSNGSINWYTTPTGGSSISTSSSFIQAVSSTTTYYAECTNNFLSVCFTDRVAVMATFESTPTSPTGVLANKNLVCPNGSVSLSATCASGTVKWYNASTGGTLLGSGSPLVQNPTISTTYYAACESGSCTPSPRVATAQVVVGNIQNTLTLTTAVTGTQSFLAAQNINASNVVNAPANIKYLASNFVQLNPGFSVGSGSVFESKIESIQACP